MLYHISKTIDAPFEEAISRVSEALQREGFGILTDIEVAATLKKKLDVDFRKYRISRRLQSAGRLSGPSARRQVRYHVAMQRHRSGGASGPDRGLRS